MIPSLTAEEFIKKAKSIHGNKYDYSKVVYKNNHTKVCIVCLDHGEFYQSPMGHLNKNGCLVCKNVKLRSDRKLTLDQFIEKARAIHGNKYDYSKVNYINNHTNIVITCFEHGDFEQLPAVHFKGNGCSYCSGNKLSHNEFIQKAKAVHGNRYDYSKVKYINTYTKIIITCKKHGDFNQRPSHHLRGNNCPKCNQSIGEQSIKEILDKYNIKYTQEYKIPGTNYRFEYDFYLPDHNLLIEFHGGQHYFPVKHFGGEEYFKYIKKCDIFKKELAKLSNIPLIEFNYKQLKELSKERFEEMVLKIILK